MGNSLTTAPSTWFRKTAKNTCWCVQGSDTPGNVEALSAATAGQFEPYLDKDVTVSGDIYGSVIWRARVVADG